MTAGAANMAARELVKAYFENQTTNVHWPQDSHARTGEGMAEMMTAMHAKLFEYFQKVKD